MKKLALLPYLMVIAFFSLGFSDDYRINDLEDRISSLESKISRLESHDHYFDYARKSHDHDSDYADEDHDHNYADEFHTH